MLFTPYRLGALTLPNRLVMPPMTRSRAAAGDVPTPLMAQYYAQRASAGLIVSEGTQISPQGQGYAWTPGIYSPAQVAGWKQVTDAVHQAGGRIFAQLWHVGRISHVDLQPGGVPPLSSSALLAEGVKVFVDPGQQGPEAGVGGMVQHSMPRALTLEEIPAIVQQFAHAARNALDAGFDGVELHGANGYLINQFLDPGANQRSDAYGGDAARRNRFALDVVAAVIAEIGADRVGIRLSPYGVFNEMSGDYAGITEQYDALATAAGGLGLAYLHLVDHSAMGAPKPEPATVQAICQAFRAAGGGTVILSGGYDAERAEADLQSGAADLVAFGRPFIANPDLVARLQNGNELAVPDQASFYSPGAAGYTDYPVRPL